MAATLKPKRSAVASAVPTTANLADGEIAVNTTDRALFVRVGAAIVDLLDVFARKAGATFTGAVSGTSLSMSGTVSDAAGNVRRVPPVTANANTTLAATHLNAIVEKSNTGTYYYYLNAGVGAQGDAITFLNSGTSGSMYVSAGSGVSLIRNGATYSGEVKPGSMMTILRTATTNKWVC